jgi:hypothetical protein
MESDYEITFDASCPWYHGSPLVLELLREGSTITQDEELARAFSHKPAVLALEDDTQLLQAGARRIRHNGTLPGLLYIIDEPVSAGDVYPHPQTSMTPGLEWLTRRSLRLRLLGPVPVNPSEFLTEADIEELRRRMG